MQTRRFFGALFAFAVMMLATSWTRPAHAYAWMVKHGYTGCAVCHADPSGGGLLTAYGRAQSEILLRSHYDGKNAEEEDPGKLGDFAFGALPLPDSLLLGGDYRGAYFNSKVAGSPATHKYLQMQADLEGQLSIDRLRFNGSIGYDHEGAQLANITTRDQDNLIAREYWVGYDIGEDKQWLLRAGRINLPYGLRTIEHTMFIHSPPALAGSGTRDDINQGQETGVSLAYNGEKFRGELMAIAGNYQLNPDAFRERGYSGYIEWEPDVHYAFGASSLVTHADQDLYLSTALWRQAHGVFARVSPWDKLALLAEFDALIDSVPNVPASQSNTHLGYATMLQADLEPWQGLHFMVTGEATLPPYAQQSSSFGGWLSSAWFFAPHADVRVDFIEQSLYLGSPLGATTLLAQLHVFL